MSYTVSSKNKNRNSPIFSNDFQVVFRYNPIEITVQEGALMNIGYDKPIGMAMPIKTQAIFVSGTVDLCSLRNDDLV